MEGFAFVWLVSPAGVFQDLDWREVVLLESELDGVVLPDRVLIIGADSDVADPASCQICFSRASHLVALLATWLR